MFYFYWVNLLCYSAISIRQFLINVEEKDYSKFSLKVYSFINANKFTTAIRVHKSKLKKKTLQLR